MRFFIIMILLMLSGCFNLNFDSLEYDRYIGIYESTSVPDVVCKDRNTMIKKSHELNEMVNRQFTYTKHRVNRQFITNAAANLKVMVDNFQEYVINHEDVSTYYCEEKIKNINDGAINIIDALGNL